MKIISTNLSNPVTIHWNGRELVTGIFKKPQPKGIFLSAEGVRGDTIGNPSVHGDICKAGYLFPLEQYPYWKERYPDLEWDYGMFGENITVEGLDETTLWMGSCYRIGEALVRITTPREPCFKLGIRFGDQGIIDKFIRQGHPGTYVEVLEEGWVNPGDSMVLQVAPGPGISIRQFYNLLYARSKDKDLINKALSLSWLPDEKKEKLSRWL